MLDGEDRKPAEGLLSDPSLSPLEKEFISNFLTLSTPEMEAVYDFMKSLASGIDSDSSHQVPST